MFCKKGALKKSFYLKRDYYRCFPVNFGKFFRKPFFKEHLRGCFRIYHPKSAQFAMTDAPSKKILICSIKTNIIMYNIFRCSDCQKLAPEFERAATELGTKSADLAKVLVSIIKNRMKKNTIFFFFFIFYYYCPLRLHYTNTYYKLYKIIIESKII